MSPPKQFDECIRFHTDTDQKEKIVRLSGGMPISGFVRMAVHHFIEQLLSGMTVEVQLSHEETLALKELQIEEQCSAPELFLKAFRFYVGMRRRQRSRLKAKQPTCESLTHEAAA